MFIPLTKGLYAEIDDEDYPKIAGLNYYASNNGRYAARREKHGRRKLIFMHHDILGVEPDPDKPVDHINGNGLNNRKANLRQVTREINMQNQDRHKFRLGVSIDRTYNKYKAYIDRPGRARINVGTYNTREDAEYALAVAKEML